MNQYKIRTEGLESELQSSHQTNEQLTIREVENNTRISSMEEEYNILSQGYLEAAQCRDSTIKQLEALTEDYTNKTSKYEEEINNSKLSLQQLTNTHDTSLAELKQSQAACNHLKSQLEQSSIDLITVRSELSSFQERLEISNKLRDENESKIIELETLYKSTSLSLSSKESSYKEIEKQLLVMQTRSNELVTRHEIALKEMYDAAALTASEHTQKCNGYEKELNEVRLDRERMLQKISTIESSNSGNCIYV